MIIGSFTSRLELFEVGIRHDGCCTLYSHNSMRYTSAQCDMVKFLRVDQNLKKIKILMLIFVVIIFLVIVDVESSL